MLRKGHTFLQRSGVPVSEASVIKWLLAEHAARDARTKVVRNSCEQGRIGVHLLAEEPRAFALSRLARRVR
jgi:hypothetical protein